MRVTPVRECSPGAVTLTQLRLGSFVAKASYPSPVKGRGGKLMVTAPLTMIGNGDLPGCRLSPANDPQADGFEARRFGGPRPRRAAGDAAAASDPLLSRPVGHARAMRSANAPSSRPSSSRRGWGG